ncbi:interferon-induced protein 44-like [Ruditapes philippinarum]|uniref:interferon-induced protein 44-like n=1 Tax=Ruditapes philippinarum TaxID=129788 RepID=UPI00295BF43B|nr:interferon-induced protein 44-like [Ruditapes philippinarum]
MIRLYNAVKDYFLQTASPPPKLTTVPWRETSKRGMGVTPLQLEMELIQQIKKLQPQNRKQPIHQRQEINLLIQGPVSAGKSSFINSVLSYKCSSRITKAGAGSCSDSYTKCLADYTEEELPKGYRIFDCMGLEPTDRKGFHINDFELLIEGHIKTGYQFNHLSPITNSNNKFRKTPNFWNKMHCVIFVVSAVSIQAGLQAEYVIKINDMQKTLKDQDIPSILILTKVDELCDEVEKDITKMFWSIKVRDAVQTAKDLFGIEVASVYPVKNYVKDLNIYTEMNIPLLLALKGAMHVAEAKINRYKERLRQENDEDNNN